MKNQIIATFINLLLSSLLEIDIHLIKNIFL